MSKLRNLWNDEKGQVGWPGLVGALIIAFLAIVVYKVLFS